ncbi:MAG TPA: histidine kinase dimerization/phospho-acceptor domain-containing protein, partial [Phycisphaerae bacterium]|nr:histidine kinase dimerization/phospho-acceptor domain-containing protein [Phycisphaerae bacterium]
MSVSIVLAAMVGFGAGAALGAILAARRMRRLYVRSEQLEKQVAESERMAYVGRLTSGLAHELKNPLSTLNLNLQLLAEDLSLPQTEAERRTARKLTILQSETRRLEEILEAFLRFAGRMELRRKRLDVGSLVGDLLAFYEPQAVQHGITLREQVDAGLPWVDADADLLKQALLNIILNAQAVMTEGGELMVAVRSADGGVAISVTDTGPGIPADRQDRIF